MTTQEDWLSSAANELLDSSARVSLIHTPEILDFATTELHKWVSNQNSHIRELQVQHCHAGQTNLSAIQSTDESEELEKRIYDLSERAKNLAEMNKNLDHDIRLVEGKVTKIPVSVSDTATFKQAWLAGILKVYFHEGFLKDGFLTLSGANDKHGGTYENICIAYRSDKPAVTVNRIWDALKSVHGDIPLSKPSLKRKSQQIQESDERVSKNKKTDYSPSVRNSILL